MAKFKVEIIIDDGDYDLESDLRQDLEITMDERNIIYTEIKVEKVEE